MTDDAELSAVLDRSTPPCSAASLARDTALDEMAVASRPAARRLRARAAAIIAGSALTVGVGGVAVADVAGWTSWWADDAVREASYELPSGAVCEIIEGNVRGPEDAVNVAKEFMADPNLVESLASEIDAAYEAYREAESVATLADGSTVDAGPGTIYWSDDVAYERAVDSTVGKAVIAAVEEAGLSADGVSWEGEYRCPGLVPAESNDAVHIRSDW